MKHFKHCFVDKTDKTEGIYETFADMPNEVLESNINFCSQLIPIWRKEGRTESVEIAERCIQKWQDELNRRD